MDFKTLVRLLKMNPEFPQGCNLYNDSIKEKMSQVILEYIRTIGENEIHITIWKDVVMACYKDDRVKFVYSHPVGIMIENEYRALGNEIEKKDKVIFVFLSIDKDVPPQRIQVDPVIGKRFVQLLEKKDIPFEFDCQCFVEWMQGIKNNGWENITTEKCKEEDLKPWDVVYIEKSNGKKVHACMYLGNGLYLSKMGQGGDIHVTNLESMIRCYNSDVFSPHRIVNK